jgi:hypothetical protein
MKNHPPIIQQATIAIDHSFATCQRCNGGCVVDVFEFVLCDLRLKNDSNTKCTYTACSSHVQIPSIFEMAMTDDIETLKLKMVNYATLTLVLYS